MKIEKMFVVTKAYDRSILDDILFVTDVEGLRRQFLGGLKPEEIVGIFTNRDEAKFMAEIELYEVKR